MQKALRITGNGLAHLGVAVTCVGLYFVGFALFAPTQPPPSLNEGHGLAWVVGLMIAVAGLMPLTIGLALRSASKKSADVLSNREDPLHVSGEIVNTRPSGTRPR